MKIDFNISRMFAFLCQSGIVVDDVMSTGTKKREAYTLFQSCASLSWVFYPSILRIEHLM